jgi:hypothetical protein
VASEAVVTLKLTPSDFDLVRESLDLAVELDTDNLKAPDGETPLGARAVHEITVHRGRLTDLRNKLK